MKNLKISLTTLVFAIILTISTGVFAADRSAILDDSVIKMPGSLNNGKGTVSTTTLSGATLSYQFVLDGINADKVSKIERYEQEIAIAQAYNKLTNEQLDASDESDPNYKAYKDLLNAYKAKYYAGVTDESAMKLQDGTRINSSSAFTETKIDNWESAIETLYGTRGDNWTNSADGKTVELDLSTFSGTKYVVLWARYTKNGANQYRPQWYKVTGTKTESKNETKNETKPSTTKNNNSTPKSISTGKADGSSTASKLPHTGVSDVVLGALATISTVAGVSYVRYRKIK